MARTDPQMNIRLPLELKKRLAAAAKKNRRSINSEVVMLLEAAMRSEQGKGNALVAENNQGVDCSEPTKGIKA